MTDPDYTDWKRDALAELARSETPVPPDHVLENCYDDGVDPDGIAAAVARHAPSVKRPIAASVQDVIDRTRSPEDA